MNMKLATSLLKALQKKPLVTPDIAPYMLPDNVTYRTEKIPHISGWILVEVICRYLPTSKMGVFTVRPFLKYF